MSENKITPDYMCDEHSYLAHVRALQDAACSVAAQASH